ncbi:dol-P-Man:Man(7)GlcNAc(2)-PP-Dol alpha-1,6-mannosyltransferase-like [Prosopis cineraria]|uniref:dol-P-Man:Man(7)GlcNAc(2)-PP-Dol alpha-1,6-mannosyltransferase-like n=1 Tax=Prosopis cineraria TaxID=364024 RepID=UPI0024105755|nr:dol-P-Man:Man(7)GlcNAc(2)-PP-Dol alpha-1,6-mannosyltransferase-like [Prosopis cineraria]
MGCPEMQHWMAFLSIGGLTVLIDSVFWKRLLWPEFEVYAYGAYCSISKTLPGSNIFLDNCLSELHMLFIGTSPQRSLVIACCISSFPGGCWLSLFLDGRVDSFIFPVLSFILIYSKLPHKELRFIVSSVPIFTLSASIAANRMNYQLESRVIDMFQYNNKKKPFWTLLFFILLGLLSVSVGCSITTFMASYWNYPSGHALKELHRTGVLNDANEQWVHIDTFSAMNGISRFCESDSPWRYSKEEHISLHEFPLRNFTFLINECPVVMGSSVYSAKMGSLELVLDLNFHRLHWLRSPKCMSMEIRKTK